MELTMNTERTEIETQIIEQAWKDPAFREALRRDPRAALAEAFGAPLPPGINVTVLEETPTERYLVLPPRPLELADLQVGDAELALAGGGRTLRPSACIWCGEIKISGIKPYGYASVQPLRTLRRRSC
jgi:hypothetical protein